jgi:hypothetical protein
MNEKKFLGTFRYQTYWLLATRGAWRVLWTLASTGRFEPAKTDRATGRRVHTSPSSAEAARARGADPLAPWGEGTVRELARGADGTPRPIAGDESW